MKLLRLCLITTLLLGGLSNMVLAQGDDLAEIYTVADSGGVLSINYPTGWMARERVPGWFQLGSAEQPAPGEVVLTVMSPETLRNAPEARGLPDNPTLEDVLNATSQRWLVIDTMSPIEAITINDAPAVRAHDESEPWQSMIVVINFEGAFVFLVANTALGELADFEPLIMAISESVVYAVPEPPDLSALIPLTAQNAAGAQLLLNLSDEDIEVTDAALNADGSLLAMIVYDYDGEGTEVVWVVDVATGDVGVVLGGYVSGDAPFDVTFTADGSQLVIAQSDGTIAFVDPATGEINRTLSYPSLYQNIALSPDDSLAAVETYNDENYGDGFAVIDLESGEPVFGQEVDEYPGVNALRFSPDGSLLAVLVEERVYLVDVASPELGEPFIAMEGDYNQVNDAAFSPDGGSLAIVDGDYMAHVYDLESGALLYSLDRSEDHESLDFVAFSPDGSVLALAQNPAIVTLVDVASGEILAELTQLADRDSEAFDMSGDGGLMVSAGGKFVMLWGVIGE